MTNDGLKIAIGVLAAIFVALLVTIGMKSGSSANGPQVTAGPTTVVSRSTPATGVIGSAPVSTPNSSVNNNQQLLPTTTLVPKPPTNTPVPPLPTATWTPLPPTATPVPITGTLRIEMRHVDGSPFLNTTAELFFQATDINGDPILGQKVGSTTSGNTGAAEFNEPPGRYIVLLSLAGKHFRPELDRPGLVVDVTIGQTTQVSLRMGLVISTLPGASESCLIVENPDGSAYDASCKGFSDGFSRVEILPGTYVLSFTFGDLVVGYSAVGQVTVSAGQTIEKHCTSTAAPFQVATCD